MLILLAVNWEVLATLLVCLPLGFAAGYAVGWDSAIKEDINDD